MNTPLPVVQPEKVALIPISLRYYPGHAHIATAYIKFMYRHMPAGALDYLIDTILSAAGVGLADLPAQRRKVNEVVFND